MKRTKKVFSIILSIVFLLTANIGQISYADGTQQLQQQEQVEKYMGLLRYVSYSKNKDPQVLYGYLSEQEEQIELGKEVSFTSLFPSSSLKGKIEDYELVSVEPYVNNFHFGASIYDDTVFDNQYPTDYFPVYPDYLKNKFTYQSNYVNYSVSNLTISNPKLTEKGITANMSCVLGHNGIAYVKQVKEKIPSTDRYIDSHLYRLVGGKANADAIYISALERLRGKSKEQLDKENGYIWFVPYVVTLKKKAPELDLSVVSIDVQKKYPPNTEISVPVQVKSTAPNKILTDVSLSYKNKKKPIKLLGNDYVTFDVKTPASGCMTLTAEINEDRSIKEKDYTNNKKSVQICVEKPKEETPITGCPPSVTWEETDWRWETETYESCHTNSKGEEKCTTKSRKVKVYYTFTYKAELKSTLTLKDRTGGQVNNVNMKSGYGFMANVNSTVTWKQLSGAWNRSPKQKPKNATTVVVKTNFSNTNLVKAAEGKFVTPINATSKTGAKVIYTPVSLKDGTYTITAYVTGATAGGKEMCNTLTGKIKIKGNMHEDSIIRPTDNDKSFNSGSSKTFP
ncbi:hypothetical protein [Filifactor alocis]|uniref:hypothetical protein n=1 Tax=Filifactor alocis TaxID=143361 RepID=UPI003C6F4596